MQRRGRLLRDTMFPLRKVDDVTKIASVAADRQTLEQMLGLNRGFLADRQSGLVILAPLLAGMVAAFSAPLTRAGHHVRPAGTYDTAF